MLALYQRSLRTESKIHNILLTEVLAYLSTVLVLADFHVPWISVEYIDELEKHLDKSWNRPELDKVMMIYNCYRAFFRLLYRFWRTAESLVGKTWYFHCMFEMFLLYKWPKVLRWSVACDYSCHSQKALSHYLHIFKSKQTCFDEFGIWSHWKVTGCISVSKSNVPGFFHYKLHSMILWNLATLR